MHAARGAIVTGMTGLALLSGRAASASAPTSTVVFSGGCYWGIEAVFKHVRGVTEATSGFAVPMPPTSAADSSAGRTGYAEAVQVTYDPTQVTYQQLLAVFFLVAHDPTEVDRQGPDVGPQYRSIVFVDDSGQERMVESYIDHLTAGKVYPAPIATHVTRLQRFRAAPPDQQDYVAQHPDEPYVVHNDAPKLGVLRTRFPELYRN